MNEVFYIIGGTGHVGLNVVKNLVKNGKKVRVLISSKNKIKYLPREAEIFIGNVLKKETLSEFFNRDKKQIAYIIDCTNNFSVNENVNFNKLHVSGINNVLDYAKENKFDKYVYLSSILAHVSDEIITSYGKSKQNAEKLIIDSENQLNVSIAVAPLVYGPNDYNNSIVNKLFYDIFKGNKRKYIDANLYVEFVGDIANELINTALYGKCGDMYFLGGKKKSSLELFKEFNSICLNKKKIKSCKIEKLIKYDDLINKYWELKKVKPIYSKNFLLSLNVDISKKNFSSNKDILVKSKNIDYSLKELKDFFDNL